MMRAKLFIVTTLVCLTRAAFAQTPAKEAMNSFALYTSKNDFSQLEKAKKHIDEAYKTRKDSISYRNNLIRSLVYSSLSYSDSTRKLNYVKDPLDEAVFSLERLKNPKLNFEHEPEIKYIKKQLAKSWMQRANRAIANYEYQQAFSAFLSVDSLSPGNYNVTYNLAVLSEKLGNTEKAINYYQLLVKDRQRVQPDYFLALSNLYESSGNSNKSLETLQEGRKVFPGNADILFKLINICADSGAYSMVESLIDDALKFDPNNLSLNYLAGFTFESLGKNNKAEQFYKKVISIEQNSYEGHYALGLLYLNLYFKNKVENPETAKRHLLKASEINPNSVNVLKSLAMLYNKTGSMVELEKVNNKLKQFILN